MKYKTIKRWAGTVSMLKIILIVFILIKKVKIINGTYQK